MLNWNRKSWFGSLAAAAALLALALAPAQPSAEPVVVAHDVAAAAPRQEAAPSAVQRLKKYLGQTLTEIARNLFQLRQVEIHGSVRFSADVFRTSFGNPWLWEVAGPGFWEQLEANPWAEKTTVRWKIFPLRAEVEIREIDPWLVAEYGRQTWLVSRAGKLVQPLKNIQDASLVIEASELPRLDGIDTAAAGAAVSGETNLRFNYAVQALRQLDLAGWLPYDVDRLSYLGDAGIEVSARDPEAHPRVLLRVDSLSEAHDALRRLAVVAVDLERRGEKPAVIDLRFADRAVIAGAEPTPAPKQKSPPR